MEPSITSAPAAPAFRISARSNRWAPSTHRRSTSLPQDFRDGFPGITKRFEWFAIDYTGRFWIENPGDYAFLLTSDDGATLSIDDALVIDNDGQHPPQDANGKITLTRGVHRIRVAYFQGPRFEVALVLKVAPPGEPLRIFSTDEFKPPPDFEGAIADDRVQVDNEFVRVLKATVEPHQKTPLHTHEFNRVMIYLNSGRMEVRYADGRVEKQRFKSGEAAWSPKAGPHTSENVGRTPVRVIEIELKNPAPSAPAPRAQDLDPLAIDPKHNILLFENDQVRVFRSWREPGATETIHEHTGPGRVAVFLTDIRATIKSAGGQTQALSAAAGDVAGAVPSSTPPPTSARKNSK